MLKTVLIVILIIIASSGLGGLVYYFRQFKALGSETSDLIKAIIAALQDGKLSAEEKETIIKEAVELSPIAKDIKGQLLEDAKELGGKITAKVRELIEKHKAKNA